MITINGKISKSRFEKGSYVLIIKGALKGEVYQVHSCDPESACLKVTGITSNNTYWDVLTIYKASAITVTPESHPELFL